MTPDSNTERRRLNKRQKHIIEENRRVAIVPANNLIVSMDTKILVTLGTWNSKFQIDLDVSLEKYRATHRLPRDIFDPELSEQGSDLLFRRFAT